MATKNPMTTIRPRTFSKERDALAWMVLLNRSRRGRTDLSVIVDGPSDGEFTVMNLREAIEGEFVYRWEV